MHISAKIAILKQYSSIKSIIKVVYRRICINVTNYDVTFATKGGF